MVIQEFSHKNQEAHAGKTLGVWYQPMIHSKFQAKKGITVRPCHK